MVVVIRFVRTVRWEKFWRPWRNKEALPSPSAQFKVPPVGLDLRFMTMIGSITNPFGILLYPRFT